MSNDVSGIVWKSFAYLSTPSLYILRDVLLYFIKYSIERPNIIYGAQLINVLKETFTYTWYTVPTICCFLIISPLMHHIYSIYIMTRGDLDVLWDCGFMMWYFLSFKNSIYNVFRLNAQNVLHYNVSSLMSYGLKWRGMIRLKLL